MICASQISKRYGNVHALHATDLHIQENELVAITGPSGAGKSTLLHLLSGLEPTDTGSVSINGRKLNSMSRKQMQQFRNLDIGFIFQFHYLLPEFTALENVMMPLMIGGMRKKEAEAQAVDILQKVGLKHRFNHKSDSMSGGEQQRVAIARAIINKPKVLFADEPTGNLDSKTTEEVFNLLLELKKEIGMTIVAVTHNLSLADKMERVIIVKDGKINTDK